MRIGKQLIVNPSKSTSTESAANGEASYYKVKSGDTLGAIAQRHGVSVRELCNLNNISTRTTLNIGTTLRVS